MLSAALERDLIAWILTEATAHNDGEALIAGVCDRLLASGTPLWRLSVAVPTIHPTVRGISLTWIRGLAMSRLDTEHADGDAVFRRSPIHALITTNRTFGRWRLDADPIEAHPLLTELRADGATDYALFVVPFVPTSALIGTGISVTSDSPHGFSDNELEQVRRLMPALGLAVFRLSLWFGAHRALATYVGPMTGRRVMTGEVRRGEGERIEAAILLADLAGFTSLADQHEPDDVVRWLNDHLEAVGDAVLEAGGEILKFTGDGLLAVFPLGEARHLPCDCCERALAAARAARDANLAVNARRESAGLPVLRVDIALHFGDVIYGNVGTTSRLDFTTIGRAVNEASRMEALCDTLGRDIVLSDTFARRCSGPFEPLGAFALRGLAAPRRIWGLV